MSVMISEDKKELVNIKRLLQISDAVCRIDENCEEKSGSDNYRMYDDISLINELISELLDEFEHKH